MSQLEKFGLYIYFFGSFVAVVDDDLADFAKLAQECGSTALMRELEQFVIAGVPGGFVVDQHLDVFFARDVADGDRVFERGSERLFDHGADVVARSGLNDFAMIGDGGVDQDGVGMLLGEHFFEVGVEEFGVEMEFVGVVRGRKSWGSTMATSVAFSFLARELRKPLAWPWTRPTRATRMGFSGSSAAAGRE